MSNETPGLAAFIADSQDEINQELQKRLDELQASVEPRLAAAMSYSLLGPGKRIRPILVIASAHACNGQGHLQPNAVASACALEAIHAYSLIHDDLPAMDDDDLRRGRPTCHIAFDEATAILAGDALQCLAFDWLSGDTSITAETRLQLIQQLACAAGAKGMVGGQSLDLSATDTAVDLQYLEQMHRQKTGALIKASVTMGATASQQCTNEQRAALEKYGSCIGLAFQIQDDVLDVTSDTQTLGKQQGADQALNKSTYVSLLGLEGAREKAEHLKTMAIQTLAPFGERSEILAALADYIVQRRF